MTSTPAHHDLAGLAGLGDLPLAVELARRAGTIALELRQGGLDVAEKTSASDVVTNADTQAEAFISSVLATLRPEDGLLGEEGASRPGSSGRMWVIDPVDGTFNFATGLDYWCCAIALVDADGRPLCAAVYRPATDDLYAGGPGMGLRHNGTLTAPDMRLQRSASSAATYLGPGQLTDSAELTAAWTRALATVSTYRVLGAGSVDLALVASGLIDVWFQHSVATWDWLPGKALVLAAGGTTETVEAAGVTWRIAGRPHAVAAVAEALRAA